jgi:hypothetical protein
MGGPCGDVGYERVSAFGPLFGSFLVSSVPIGLMLRWCWSCTFAAYVTGRVGVRDEYLECPVVCVCAESSRVVNLCCCDVTHLVCKALRGVDKVG